MKTVKILLFAMAFSFAHTLFGQNSKVVDSINIYYRQANDKNLSIDEQLKKSISAKKLSDALGIDSVKLRVDRQLSLLYYHNEMYDEFLSANHNNLKLAKRLKDSTAILITNNNLGNYHLFDSKKDSAYYYFSDALNFIKPNDELERKASLLILLANIQQEAKAYAGAEDDAIRAIKTLNKIPKREEILQQYWNSYNLLAIISERNLLENKTFEYYDKSISYSDQMKDGFGYKISSINNKANAYLKFGDFDKALQLFNALLDMRSDYEKTEPDMYPIVLINIGRTKFEAGNYEQKKIENYFIKAREFSVKSEFLLEQMAASLGLAKLYLRYEKDDLAREFGNETLKISNEVNNNEYKMEALLVLAELYEGEKGKDFLKTHIKLSDSLQANERLEKNKFARVKFDTDQLEAENEQISKENLYLLLISIALLFTAILVYVVISQRAKNKELVLVQEQQKANEDIYNLMLGQQDKVDEARSQEKIRVSKELHDGVLGELFGVRLSLDSLNFTEGKEAIANRANYINKLKTIEDEIREISHKMNTDFVSGSGFMDIVSELIENQAKAYGFIHHFNYTDDVSWEFVSNKTKINIYRILQESMQNIYKHAQAKHVKIDILREKERINIYIEDDGKGFDVSKSKKGIGLKNMISRIKDINGKINWVSQPNRGTTVEVKIPYKI